MAQLVKNPPALREAWLPSLGWDDPLEKGKAAHSSIPAWRIPWTVQSMRSQSQTRLSDFPSQSLCALRGRPGPAHWLLRSSDLLPAPPSFLPLLPSLSLEGLPVGHSQVTALLGQRPPMLPHPSLPPSKPPSARPPRWSSVLPGAHSPGATPWPCTHVPLSLSSTPAWFSPEHLPLTVSRPLCIFCSCLPLCVEMTAASSRRKQTLLLLDYFCLNMLCIYYFTRVV